MTVNWAGRARASRALAMLAALIAVALVASCQQDKAEPGGPLGACIRPDGSTLLRHVTESDCADRCPTCSWEPDRVAAAAPRDAAVYSFQAADIKDAVCANASTIELALPDSQWIEWPIGWIARDSATAAANWQSMSYTVAVDSVSVEMPDSLQWHSEPVKFECPDRTMEGVLLGPVVYLPPLTGPRTITVNYTFSADVNDGWNTYPKGQPLSFTARLVPRT